MHRLIAEGFKVHVDYSMDVASSVPQAFLSENNVRFIIKLQSADSKKHLVQDLRNGSQSELHGSKMLVEHLKSSLLTDSHQLNPNTNL